MQASSTAMVMAATSSVAAATSSSTAMSMGGSCKISVRQVQLSTTIPYTNPRSRHRCSGAGISSTLVSLHDLRIDLTTRLIISEGFISSTWRITSHGMFAGSCVGVILLVMSLEFLRRVQRSYERSNLRAHKHHNITTPGASNHSLPDAQRSKDTPAVQEVEHANPKLPLRRALVQQTIRALLHTLSFAVAYFVMLLAMYYNGYFIICILIGAFLGSFAFSWNQLRSRWVSMACENPVDMTNSKAEDSDNATEVTGCCG